MNAVTNRINTPINPTSYNVSSRNVQNSEHAKNNPSFGIEIKSKKVIAKIEWLGDDFNSAMQRLVSGATALVTQPFFDWNNKNVDEDTRRASTARTLGKIIAGMVTGVTIRQICISASKKFTQNEDILKYENKKAEKKGETLKSIPKIFEHKQQWLLPEEMKDMATARQIRKYRGAIGTFAAVLVMIATNFLIDVPLTKKLTNYFVQKFKESNENKKQSIQGGLNATI